MNLIKTLKENNEDFEFYPTTQGMLNLIYEDLSGKLAQNRDKILDIGAGTCNFKKYLVEYFKGLPSQFTKDFKYFAIEKSQTLINLFDNSTIILGTDFNESTLIDKDVNFIFCNPPYSQFKAWTSKILKETTANYIYLIIPERWKDDKVLMEFVNKNFIFKILGNDNFLDAERQARAKVDIIKFVKKDPSYDPYKTFFDDCFTFNEYIEKEEAEEIAGQLVNAKNKAEMLVDLYNGELNKFLNSLHAITSLGGALLAQVGISKSSLLTAFKMKINGLKNLYWQQVLNEIDEITSRLTLKSRETLFKKFTDMKTVDFTLSNIQSTIIWVVKNAKQFYDEQLRDLFLKMSHYQSPLNVKLYKSNEKVFGKEEWKYVNCHEISKFTLDYRIVLDYTGFLRSFDNTIQQDNVRLFLEDVYTIANNLGFSIDKGYEKANNLFYSRTEKIEHGKKYYIYLTDGNLFCEYKIFKNGNCHIKFNVEFTKAFNVEASRILGWIKNKADVVKEFDESLKGAEKYFMVNFSNQLTSNNIKLLGDK